MRYLSRLKKIVLIGLLILGGGVAYYWSLPQYHVLTYDNDRDRQFIEKLFDKDWYWLTAQSRQETNTDLWFVQKSPSTDQRYHGALIIKVLRVANDPVGFVAYYRKSFYEGYILFIDVVEQHRRKKYGRILLQHAIDDLVHQGVQVIRLVTRPQNLPAQTLYRATGFKEYERNDTYVYFEKKTA